VKGDKRSILVKGEEKERGASAPLEHPSSNPEEYYSFMMDFTAFDILFP
jgi:hypothetical protein